MNHFYTLNEAAAFLGIDRKTLRAWLKKAAITAKSSPVDERVSLLTEKQVHHLRTIHAPYRPQKHPIITPNIPHILPNKSTIPTPNTPHIPRQRPKQATNTTTAESLPDNYIGWRDWAHVHGLPETTIQKAIANKRLPTQKGPWKRDRVWVQEALDAEGQQIAHDLWSNHPKFRVCDACPNQHS